jgi:hypothetical protein
MSMATQAQIPSFLLFGGTPSGASADAAKIASQLQKLASRFVACATGSKRIAEPKQAIFEVYSRCSRSNWNGEDAEPISRDAALRAERLLLALPSYLPVPEIYGDPTGAISFEWYRRPKHRLVLSIYGNGAIEYAGLLGVGNEVYGEARMGEGLPNLIRDHLRELFTD